MGTSYIIVFLLIMCLGSSIKSADFTTSAHNNASDGSMNHTNHSTTTSHSFPIVVVDFAHVSTPFIIAAVVISASLAKIGFHLNNKLSSVFPESCLLIVVGLIVGGILFASNSMYKMNTTIFFQFLLPPIVLEAGYFMPVRPFFDNIGSILMFAVIGTLWNTLLIGLSLWGFSFSGGMTSGSINILHCLVFAALISAVDPVAVIAVFEEVHVNEILHIVVFGESLLNDAVSVVLYHMFENFSEMGQAHIKTLDVVVGFCKFFLVAILGTLIGIIYGFATSFITRFTDHVRVIEPLLVFGMGYLSYLTAEIFHFSGILACMFCGMTMNKYVEKNISQKSHTTIKYFMKMLASVCETIIFMFLGISTVTKHHTWETGFILFTLLCCLLYRALGVLVFSWILNRKRLIPISKVDQFIMAFGGLRGAIAFALVELLSEQTFPDKKLFVTTCVVVIYFTVFVQGSTIKPLVNILRVKTSTKHKPSMNEKLNARLIDHLMAGIEDVTGYQGHNDLRERYKRVNDKYIKPILIREKSKLKSGRSILNVYQKLTERDAQLYLKKNGSFTTETVLKPSDISRTNSLAHLFQLYSTTNKDNGSQIQEKQMRRIVLHIGNDGKLSAIPMPSNVSSTVLDMRALEVPSSPPAVHKDDTEIHHLLDDNLFQPRIKFTRYRKQMLPEVETQRPFHHKARLHLRKLMSPKRVTNGRRKSDMFEYDTIMSQNKTVALNTPNEHAKPRKNVSFADMAEVTIRIQEATPEPEKKSEDSGSEDGIYFTVKGDQDPNDFPDKVENTPTAAETTLPWKCAALASPLSSTSHHSLPNLKELGHLVHEPLFLDHYKKEDEKPLLIASNQNSPAHSNNIEGYTNFAINDKGYHIGNCGPAGDAGNSEPHNVVINCLVNPEMCNNRIETEHLHKTATGGSKKDDDSEGNLPLPWKSAPSDTELSHAQDVAEPAASYQLKPLPSNQVLTKPEKALVDDCLSPIPPPWKNNGERNEVEPIIIQSTPYADETAVKTEVEDDEAEKVICSSIPPPWRQLSNSSMDFIGSPSIACTLDSMRPHPSTHSFHISEAESHHSKHMHMHNLIDIPNHPPHNDYEHECDVSDTELDLGEDQYEGEEICSRWLLSCEPDIDLPVNDKEYDSEECGNIDNEMNTILLHSMSNCSTNEPEEDAHSKSEQNDCCSSSKKEGLHINAVESTTCL